MTKVQAQAVVTAIVGAGYDAHAHKISDDVWTVRAAAGTFCVAASAVANLATANGVNGLIAEAEFS